MPIAAVFIIAKTWKQPKCASIGQKINCGISNNNGALFSNKKK